MFCNLTTRLFVPVIVTVVWCGVTCQLPVKASSNSLFMQIWHGNFKIITCTTESNNQGTEEIKVEAKVEIHFESVSNYENQFCFKSNLRICEIQELKYNGKWIVNSEVNLH